MRFLAFVQINDEYTCGIHPNQRQMRVWHLAGLKTPPTRDKSIHAKNFTPPKKLLDFYMHAVSDVTEV